MKKYLIAILIGLVLCAIAFFETRTRIKQTTLFDNDHLFIFVAGEGFDEVCTPTINVEFNDAGLVDIRFETAKDEEVVWLMIVDLQRFSWEVEGDVDEFDFEGEKIERKSNNNSEMGIFRTTIHDNEHIRIQCFEAVEQSRFLTCIHTPFVCALRNDFSNFGEIYNSINSYIKSTDMNKEKEEQLANYILRSCFMVSEVGDFELSQASPTIYMTFNDDAMYKSKYSLRVKPDNYEKSFIGVEWEGSLQIYPIIEFRNDMELMCSEKITEVLYLVGSFLISTAVLELIMMVYKKMLK